MRSIRQIIIFFTLFSINSIAQNNLTDTEIAKIGWLTITSEEFLERIEMTPQFNRQIDKFSPSLKLQFLYTIIAEKLWALEAENMDLDTTEAIKTAISSIEKLYVRDALFQKEIKDKILITEEQYIKGVVKNSKSYFIKYLFSDNLDTINSQFTQLKNNIPFEELLEKMSKEDEQNEPIEVVFGDLIEPIENDLFNRAIGEITDIHVADDGWYIFKVYDIKEREFEDEEEQVTKQVIKTLEQRVGENIQNEFYREFFSKYKVDINRELFLNLSESLKKIFQRKEGLRKIKSTNLLTIDAYDILEIKTELGNEKLNRIFIEFDEKPLTLNTFIKEFFFDGFQIPPIDIDNLNQILNTKIRIFIERELLAREGYKRNLQNTAGVKNNVEMWRDYYLSQAYLSNLVENVDVSEEELNNIYESEYKSKNYLEKINVAEILVNTYEEAVKVYDSILAGEDFNKAAQKYSVREWSKNDGGILGYQPVGKLGAIGKVAENLPLNEVSQPFKSEDGYSVIKVIDRKKEAIQPPSKSMAEISNAIKRKIAFEKAFPRILENTINAANENNIEINVDLLSKLNITNINTFAIRIMGFGGKITAVPLQKPFTEWVDKWIKKPDVLP